MPEEFVDERRELDEREERDQADYQWVLHDPETQREFAGKVVAVSRRQVWGVGEDHLAALEAAFQKAGCPPRDELTLVFVEGRTVTSGRQ